MTRCRLFVSCATLLVAGAFTVSPPSHAAASNRATTQAAQTSAAAQTTQTLATTPASDLQLIPQPREVKQTGGAEFRVTRHTKIVVDKDFPREFQGAQMLQDEVASWTGWKLRIERADHLPGGSDFIYLGDATKDRRLREALGTSGLAMQQGFSPQGYAILAARRSILVGGASEQGAFYGAQTLRQLLRPLEAATAQDPASGGPDRSRESVPNFDPSKPTPGPANRASVPSYVSGLQCPAVAIRDWPAMKWRGASIDISRGPIPTLAFMEEEIRVLAGYKLNMYALYMEDVFTVKGNELFAPPDALSAQEITELADYAKKYYVTLLPELETFGHLHNILRYDLYGDLAEVPHGAVLTPTQPGTYDLLGKLIAQMSPLFPGPFFHIGADETVELGMGKTKELIAKEGLGPVYLAHIAKLDSMLKPYHKQTMFWADIAEKFPQLLPTLPKDVIPVIWTYGVKPSYDADLQPFKNAGLQIFVSPSIDNWSKVYPDFNAGFMNIRNLTRDGQAYHAMGLLNTEWKNLGEDLDGMDWPGLVFGAACGWQPGESSVKQFEDSYDWAFYRNSDHTFEDILAKLADTNSLLDGVKMDGTGVSYFWASPFSKLGVQEASTAAPVVQQLRIDAEQAWESLLDNGAKARLHAGTLPDLIFAAQRLDTLGMKFEYTQDINQLYWNAYMDMANRHQVIHDLAGISAVNGRMEDLREKVTQLRSMYEQQWRTEHRSVWLGDVLVRYDTLAATVQDEINRIRQIRDQFLHEGILPPPEDEGFFGKPQAGSNP
ncbi:MAG TPA: glycoside hydrolase family 20 zincin-like fold domain-containing protein [Candidatus Acidoferrales bacterium]|nr:glycoside hydrolase family 20 zincin-like fold domain-containing protein [Candidatus Acidoferrales bacterium]